MPAGDHALDELLEFIKATRGFDFTGYKRSSIERRVTKRMSEVGVESYEDYADFLELHAGEFAELFNTLLINVTGFFRDPATWEYLAQHVIPDIVNGNGSDAPLRIWCAGCASGEEPYTVAMILARAIGEDAFRERVKIYATDVDDDALDRARLGTYLPRQVEDVPAEALDRFFERTDQRYVFRKELRRAVIFGRNDLVQDAPISRVDLLVCRNTLMYFTAETQAHILRRFHFGLADTGVLLLGKSEMLITHADLFTPIDLKWRMFRKVMRPALRDRVRVLAADPTNGASQSIADNLRESAFDSAPVPQVVLDADRSLVMANVLARRVFGLGLTDFGRPVQDLELSYRPLELRAHLDVVAAERRTAEIRSVRWHVGDSERVLDVRISPLMADGVMLGTAVTYEDVTDGHSLQAQVASAKHQLEEAYEELQSTVEELETTNEELQSANEELETTNEELETTNEELQSTNEELETMNEELQSSNEELETMNEELRNRTLELNDLNTFLETILATIGLAVAVLDRRQHVQIWNGQARELWGLSSTDSEDQHFLSLDIGLPTEQLKHPIRMCLSGESTREELVVTATNRRGREFECRVVILPLGKQSGGDVSGAIVMMEPVSES